MSFTKIKRAAERRAKVLKAKREAQWERRHFTTAMKLPERPDSLMEALRLVPIITYDPETSEVLWVSPRVENSAYAIQ